MQSTLLCKFCEKPPKVDEQENSIMIYCQCSTLPIYVICPNMEIAIDMWNTTYGKPPSGELFTIGDLQCPIET